MTINYKNLEKLNELRLQKEQILREEERLSMPLLSDRRLLPGLYGQFERIVEKLPAHLCPDRRAEKKLFLFIILYLYSPPALTGQSVDKGLRTDLARIMKFHSVSSVSYHCEGLGLWYSMYPDFRKALDYIYPRLVSNYSLLFNYDAQKRRPSRYSVVD